MNKKLLIPLIVIPLTVCGCNQTKTPTAKKANPTTSVEESFRLNYLSYMYRKDKNSLFSALYNIKFIEANKKYIKDIGPQLTFYKTKTKNKYDALVQADMAAIADNRQLLQKYITNIDKDYVSKYISNYNAVIFSLTKGDFPKDLNSKNFLTYAKKLSLEKNNCDKQIVNYKPYGSDLDRYLVKTKLNQVSDTFTLYGRKTKILVTKIVKPNKVMVSLLGQSVMANKLYPLTIPKVTPEEVTKWQRKVSHL